MTEQKAQYQTAMVPLADTMQLGDVLAKSGFFSDSRGAAQAVVKILAGREIGVGPIAAMTGVNIIKGRVTLSANIMAAAIKRDPRYDYRIKRLDDDGCELEFYEGGKAVGTSSFDKADAKQAGLSGDNWTKYPRNMFFARAISNGAKWFCPDIFGGPVYTPDELGAAVDGETGEIIDGETSPPWTPEVVEANQGDAPKPTNGAVKKAWFLKVLDEITYYRATNHVVNTLKQLGYEAFEPDKADAMFAALQAHAKAKADEEAA